MSLRRGINDPSVPQPESFQFTPENQERAAAIIAKYPKGFQASAVMPLLELAQAQHDNWLPKAAMDLVAEMLEMPKVRVYEVATFYTMYNLHPIGRYHVQVCTTTPCWLRGSADIMNVCTRHLGVENEHTTDDGMFTVTEVECLGACVNAPMVQINEDYYEDLTPDRMREILDDLAAGRDVAPGSQIGRRGSCAEAGPTALLEQAARAGVSARAASDPAAKDG